MNNKIKVMMTTEGTYPFHHGGVSTWCDTLISNLQSDLDFVVYSIIMNPFVTQKFSLPKGAKLIKVPLWGTEEPSEHVNIPFSHVYISRKRTTNKIIKERFLPLFIELVDEIVSYEKDSVRFGKTLYALYEYFQKYEYKKTFKSELTWNAYKDFIIDFCKNKNSRMDQVGSYAIIQSLGWIYRFMIILNTPLPEVDVTHSAAAAFCGIPCVLAKLKNNTPFILTEHGVYLREQYLSLSKTRYSSFLNTFLIRMVHSVVNLNYSYADQVSPVCKYNTRWEERFGVKKDKIQVIYNGVDKDVFIPKLNLNKNKYPTVVSVARIDPVKDTITLIKSAAIVKKEIPNVKFIVYGSVSVQEYFEECNALINELSLQETFILAGHTSDVSAAYQSGDIVALSSISEAFPYSVVEAMMVGKAVISTDVGGISEAMSDSGILVSPRKPEELAKGIVTLLKNPELCATLGEEGRQRALNCFTMKNVQELYHKSYTKLALGKREVPKEDKIVPDDELIKKEMQKELIQKRKQKLLVEKGYALLENGYYSEGIIILQKAIKEIRNLSLTVIIITKIAEAYNCLGEYDKALVELEKVEAIMSVLNTNKTA